MSLKFTIHVNNSEYNCNFRTIRFYIHTWFLVAPIFFEELLMSKWIILKIIRQRDAEVREWSAKNEILDTRDLISQWQNKLFNTIKNHTIFECIIVTSIKSITYIRKNLSVTLSLGISSKKSTSLFLLWMTSQIPFIVLRALLHIALHFVSQINYILKIPGVWLLYFDFVNSQIL